MRDLSAFESAWPARANLSLFANGGEEAIFDHLSSRFKHHLVAPQVSFSALIPRGQMYPVLRQIMHTREPKRIKRAANYLSKCRVDFVIYSRHGRVVAVIECNGKSHLRTRRRKGDILKARFLEQVGVPLIAFGIHHHLQEEFGGKRRKRFRMQREESSSEE